MKPESEGKDILVPLTGSMYVPGTLVDPNKVIVDVGTGYYVEKDVAAAKDYFNRKVRKGKGQDKDERGHIIRTVMGRDISNEKRQIYIFRGRRRHRR